MLKNTSHGTMLSPRVNFLKAEEGRRHEDSWCVCGGGTPPPHTAAGRDSDLDTGTRRRQGLGNAAAGTAPSDTEAVGKWDFSSKQAFTDQNQFSIPLNEPSDTTGEGWRTGCVFSRSAHVPLPTPRPPGLRRQRSGLCGNRPPAGRWTCPLQPQRKASPQSRASPGSSVLGDGHWGTSSGSPPALGVPSDGTGGNKTRPGCGISEHSEMGRVESGCCVGVRVKFFKILCTFKVFRKKTRKGKGGNKHNHAISELTSTFEIKSKPFISKMTELEPQRSGDMPQAAQHCSGLVGCFSSCEPDQAPRGRVPHPALCSRGKG